VADLSGKHQRDQYSGRERRQYLARHNPFVFFDEVRTNLAYCTNHVRPYTELAADLTNNTVARFNFLTPNLTNDMHSAATGGGVPQKSFRGTDGWAREMPKILASSAYSNGGAIFIGWDESTEVTTAHLA